MNPAPPVTSSFLERPTILRERSVNLVFQKKEEYL
jgi:hypothetical protein